MTKAFVCGHPIAHSRSPLIHGYWLEAYGIAGTYDAFDRASEDFAGFLAGLRPAGFVGGNVTLPHKEAAYAAASRHDAAAKAIGAANTLWFEGDTLVAGNTDAYGFLANLDQRLPDWATDRRSAVVLGAGGAARAVIHALIERGFDEIHIVNRTVERAQALAHRFGPESVPHGWSEMSGLVGDASLLVNTTSLGMADHADGFLPELSRLPADAVVTDIVYVPLETPLLMAARARGLRTVDGLGMLLHQAVPGFERWFGRRPEVTDDLRRLIQTDIEKSAP